jgi:hypothetical protein
MQDKVMVAITDYPSKTRLPETRETVEDQPRRHRFRLLAALAAPFRDMDDRALHKRRKHAPVRNNSKGNMFTPRAATPTPVPVRAFARADD